MSYVQNVLEQLVKKNPDQPEFIQAATEVLNSLALVIERNPKYQDWKGSLNPKGSLCSGCPGWTITARCR